jgi:hypothetical protein
LAAPLGGLAALVLTAGLSSLAPLPAPAPLRPASNAATTTPQPTGLIPDRSAPSPMPAAPRTVFTPTPPTPDSAPADRP